MMIAKTKTPKNTFEPELLAISATLSATVGAGGVVSVGVSTGVSTGSWIAGS